MSDAETTVKFAIRDAIANTALITGLRAGDPTEQLVAAIFKEITDSAVIWALTEVASSRTEGTER